MGTDTQQLVDNFVAISSWDTHSNWNKITWLKHSLSRAAKYQSRMTEWMWPARGTVRPFPNYCNHRKEQIREEVVAEEINTQRSTESTVRKKG
jgi:hypothetical protein